MRLGCDFHRFSFEAAWQTVLLSLSDPSGLGLLGTPSDPADEYEPEDLDHRQQIRVNRTVYHVAKLTNEQGR
jgi:hypothetical protein